MYLYFGVIAAAALVLGIAAWSISAYKDRACDKADARRDLASFMDYFARASAGELEATKYLLDNEHLLRWHSGQYDHETWNRVSAWGRLEWEYRVMSRAIMSSYRRYEQARRKSDDFEAIVRDGSSVLVRVHSLQARNQERLGREHKINYTRLKYALSELIRRRLQEMLDMALSGSKDDVATFISWWVSVGEWVKCSHTGYLKETALAVAPLRPDITDEWNLAVAMQFENPDVEDFLTQPAPKDVPAGVLRLRAARALRDRDWVEALIVLAYCNASPEKRLEVGGLTSNLALLVAKSRTEADRTAT